MASGRQRVKISKQPAKPSYPRVITTTHIRVTEHYTCDCDCDCDAPSPPPPRPQKKSEAKKSDKKNWQLKEIDWSTLPFSYPTTEKDHEKVNKLLKFCSEQQKEFDITDSAGFVVTILHRCLNALKVKNNVVYGHRDVIDATFPQIWLQIKDYYIDNTYLTELCPNSMKYLQDHYPICYKVGPYDQETPSWIQGSPVDSNEIKRYLRKRRIEFYADQPDFALAQSLNREQSYNFYFAMIRHMFDEYKVSVQGIDPSVRYVCWRCKHYPKAGLSFLCHILPDEEQTSVKTRAGETSGAGLGSSWKFLQCPRCMVANYCSRRCQEKDWTEKHSLTCLSRGSVNLPQLGEIPFMAENFI